MFKSIAFAGMGLSVMACGTGSKKTSSGEGSLNMTTLSPSVSEQDLSLAGATVSYSARIQGCVSGWQVAGLTEANSSIPIPDLDSNCQFKLVSVAVNGEAFNVSGQSFAQGSQFIATGANGTQLTFKVNSQIASPIAGAQSVNISFAALQQGSSTSASAVATTGVSVSGANPVELSIAKTTITAIDSVSGAGSFQFKLGCSSAIEDAQCVGVSLAGLKAGLGVYTADLDLNECKALANGGSAGTVLGAGDAHAANGGLLSSVLSGPSPLYGSGNANLVLAISSAEGGCKYFRVNVVAP